MREKQNHFNLVLMWLFIGVLINMNTQGEGIPENPYLSSLQKLKKSLLNLTIKENQGIKNSIRSVTQASEPSVEYRTSRIQAPILKSFSSPATNSQGLEYDGQFLYVAESSPTPRIYKINPDTGDTVDAFPWTLSHAPMGIGWDNTNFYISDDTSGKIYVLDTVFASVSEFDLLDTNQDPPIPILNPRDIAFDGTNLVMATASTFDILIIDQANNGNLIRSFKHPWSFFPPAGVAWDGTFYLISQVDAEGSNDFIYKYNSDGFVVEVYDAPGERPVGLAYDGQSLWVVDADTEMIHQMILDFNIPPEIIHHRITSAIANHSLTITAKVTDPDMGDKVNEVMLFWRDHDPDNLTTYSSTPMASGGAKAYSVDIPASDVTTKGLDYYITAKDAQQEESGIGNASHPLTINDIQPNPVQITLNSPENCAETIQFSSTISLPTLVSETNNLYMILDLSQGPTVMKYPVTFQEDMPADLLNDPKYRTTHLVLRRISAGTFVMGSPEDELGRDTDEPQHNVTLTQDYYIGVFEVTQKQYELVMGVNPSHFSSNGKGATDTLGTDDDMRPVEDVKWTDARGGQWPGGDPASNSFVGRLRTKIGDAGFDLPTEAQWEYACRAGTTTALYSGVNLAAEDQDPELGKLAWYSFNNTTNDEKNGTKIVGRKIPNSFGLYDLYGNVMEWCLDWYADDYGGTGNVSDPVGLPTTPSYTAEFRVVRGGSWHFPATVSRSAGLRVLATPSNRFNSIGFRLAKLVNL